MNHSALRGLAFGQSAARSTVGSAVVTTTGNALQYKALSEFLPSVSKDDFKVVQRKSVQCSALPH
jgi:hypothetical protein